MTGDRVAVRVRPSQLGLEKGIELVLRIGLGLGLVFGTLG